MNRSAAGQDLPDLIVGANYHPHDSDPATWRRDATMMREAGIRMVRLGHLAWDTFEPSDGEFRFDWFDEVMDLMQDNGIGVILDIAVRPAPLWLHRKHPSIDITDANGNRLYANHRYMEDIGDPAFRWHAMRFADALTKRYAGHPALTAFGIDNEPGDGPISYSETVRSRFIAWLEAKYGTTEALNAAWAGHRWSRRIGDFAEVGLPKSGHYSGAPERVLDFRRFVSHEVETYLAELLDIVETNAPGVLTTGNMWYYSHGRHFDYAPLAYTGRITRAGNGFYPGGSIIDNGGLRAALFGMARIQYENTTPFWCTEFTTMTAVPGSIRKSAYASLILGNQLVCGWTWQTMHAGEEQFLQGMVDWDGRPNRKLDEYRQIAAEFAKLEGRGFPYRPRPEIAVALDFPSQIASAVLPERHDAQAQTAFEAVIDRNLDARLVDLARSELDYKLLLIPGVLVLDEAAASRIRAFVERGGTAIMTSYSATLDADGQAFATTRPGRLDDVFGIRVGSYEETAMLNELAHGRTGHEGLDLEFDGRAIAAATPRFDVVEPVTADVLARAAGLDGDRPLITANRYGAGRAVYIALPARREVLDPLLESEITRLGIDPGPSVPPGVMARAVDDRHVLYLNLDAEPKSIVLQGKATGVLRETRYDGGLTLGAYDAEVVELG
ncbi:beta-galactosidase [Streptomyces sp. NBS 14/10]|uniref:beta-galactosidase n=1 Tax=Streptomyces sp. NBS 14/10 TaxID=1945643 RepID=UPI000B800A4C|nr:beta-galactosidase [Streptomyces sp. NBS 14/10]KAK1176829.1 beta-galactosidase [Streptomyces sp. NBS 14/10]